MRNIISKQTTKYGYNRHTCCSSTVGIDLVDGEVGMPW